MTSILSGLLGKTWTLSDISKVNPERQQKASGCQVFLQETYLDLEKEKILDKFKRFFLRSKSVMNTIYAIFKFRVFSETGHSYDVFIRTQYDPQGVLGMGNTVQIYCGCPDFKFKSAWTLSQHNSLFRNSRIDLDLGPAITNAPKKKPSTVLCKHSYAAVMELMRRYNSYMMNV